VTVAVKQVFIELTTIGKAIGIRQIIVNNISVVLKGPLKITVEHVISRQKKLC
jgi:hypothetical protein